MRRLSRRSFLKKSSVLLAASTVDSDIFSRGLKATRRIAVVGAGLAGLTAAYKLRQKYPFSEIHLYEGSQRIGGRAFTKKGLLGEGMLTELGGESIDESHTSIMNLAKELGITIVKIPKPTGNTEFVSVIEGKLYREEDLNRALDPLAEALKVKRQGLDQITLAQYFDELEITGWMRTMIDAACTAEYGLEPEYLSAETGPWTFSVTQDEYGKDQVTLFPGDSSNIRLVGGNSGLAQALFSKVESTIEYYEDHRFESIRQLGTGGIKTTFRRGYSSFERTYDVVLIAIPYSTLRDVEMKLPMSQQRRESITEMVYGKNFKFFGGYNQSIWDQKNLPQFAMCSVPTQMSWDNANWQNVQGVGRTFFYGGKKAFNDLRFQDPQQAVAKFSQSLDPAYPGLRESYNGRAGKMIWPQNPWSRGSYATLVPNYMTNYFDVVADPVGQVHFAGEHTSTEFGGFMNGAVDSAIEAVKYI